MPEEQVSLDERVKSARSEIDAVLEKYHLAMGAVVVFPLYKKLPAEAELALRVITRHEGEYHVAFEERKEPAHGTTN